jgi:hypothetical protein
MIVWGGSFLSTGGRYNPSTNSWLTTSTGANVPSGRRDHKAVWTGTEMIVWGGISFTNTGGRYNPSTDSWLTTSTGSNVPSARGYHSAVWTGTEMIVWGGSSPPAVNTGGRYTASSNAWLPTSTMGGTLPPRLFHTAVWTGTRMIAWGGSPLDSNVSIYCGCLLPTTSYRDFDNDGYGSAGNLTTTCDGSIPPGFVSISGDCDDSRPSAHPGAVEVCNGLDDDCDLAIDEGIAAPNGVPDLRESKVAGTTLTWNAIPSATAYDVVKGNLPTLRGSGGDFTVATTNCLANNISSPSTTDGVNPAMSAGFWYLVRPVNCGGNGTYDTGSLRQAGSRDGEIAASVAPCP